MPCVKDPPCACCREGKHCAHVLKLDALDEARLRRIERVMGAYAAPVQAARAERVETPDEWLDRIAHER